MKKFVLLTMLAAGFIHSARADERLLYAYKKGNTTTIYSCDIEMLKCSERFSDAASATKIMARGGAGDSANVIQVAGKKLFALASDGSSKVGAIFELSLDGTNRATKVTAVDSISPIERFAVGSSGKAFCYPSISPDNESRGEGSSFFVDSVVIDDTSDAKRIKIDTSKSISNALVGFIGWNPDGNALYLQIDQSSKYNGLFKIQSNGSLTKVPLKDSILDPDIIGFMPTGELLIQTMSQKGYSLVVQDVRGKVSKEIPLKHTGWLYKSSATGQLVALQTSDGEIWIKDIKSGQEKKVVGMKLDYWKEKLTLIGWID